MFGSSDKTVSVKLRADVADYKRGMADAGNSTKSFGRDAGAAVSKGRAEIEGMGKASGGAAAAVKGFAAAGAGLVTFEAVAGYLAGTVSAASDLQQTVMKSSTIFGENAREIESWATTAYDSVGLSKNAAMSAAASFGDMFNQIGFAGDKAAEMSTDVVQLAADLGSFNNLQTGDVLDRISAALRGEYDSLQAVIPNINAARVENEALARSGKKTAKELTAQEKATATLAIIQKDGAKASGDFAKSNDTLAIQQQKLNAELENFQAELGQELLPIMQEVVSFGNSSFLPFLNAMVTGYQAAGSNIGAVNQNMQAGLLMWALQMKYGTVEDAVKKGQELAKAQRDAAGGTTDMGGAAQKALPRVEDLVVSEDALRESAEKAKEAQKRLNQAILDMSDAVVDADQAEADWQAAIDDARAAIEENGRTTNKARTEIDLHTEAGRSNQEQLVNLRDRARDAAEANLAQGDSVDSVKTKMQLAREEFIKKAQQMGLNETAAKNLATQYGLTGEDVDALKLSMDKIPKEVKSEVEVATAGAKLAIAGVKAALAAIKDETVRINFVTSGTAAAQTRWRDEIANRATGGAVFGPGSETSDSIPALLSNNEHVLTAREVRAMGGHAAVERLRRMAVAGTLPRFASGGAVQLAAMGATPGPSIDYDRLARSMQGGPTFNAYGLDADAAIKTAWRNYGWELRTS